MISILMISLKNPILIMIQIRKLIFLDNGIKKMHNKALIYNKMNFCLTHKNHLLMNGYKNGLPNLRNSTATTHKWTRNNSCNNNTHNSCSYNSNSNNGSHNNSSNSNLSNCLNGYPRNK